MYIASGAMRESHILSKKGDGVCGIIEKKIYGEKGILCGKLWKENYHSRAGEKSLEDSNNCCVCNSCRS